MSHHDVEVVYELSPVQQAMLFHSVYSPGSGVYVVQVSLRLTGRLDVHAFARAWRRIVERHGILRTGFYWEDLEKPVQVVYRDVELVVEVRRGAGLSEYLDADRERGFDLTEPPLMRVALFEAGEGDHRLVWTQHHLVTDGWSLGILLRELFACYVAFAEGREPVLAPAPSYRDYIAWLQQRDLREAESFWRAALAGISEPTLLAGGDGRSAGSFRESRRRVLRLSAAETEALGEVARCHRLTLNTLIQGAWAVLLASWTGRRDVVFGTVVAGRPPDLPGVESMVGPFINTLPARAWVEPDRPLWPWLADLQERQAEARRHDYAPLFEVQRWSGLASGTALFDTLLAFESFPLDQAASGVPGLVISEVSPNELTNYPVNLVVVPGDALRFEVAFDVGHFELVDAARLLEHLAGLLRAFATAGEVTLAGLPRLTEGERQQVLLEWNDVASDFPRDACLAELFEAVARRQPGAPAVIGESEVLSYRDLDEASNRLARRLRDLDVGPETAVCISMERSPELIVGIVAILKTGGFYVPLDPGYPDDRLAFMLEDAKAEVLLVHNRTRDRFKGKSLLLEVNSKGAEGSLSREAGEGRGGGSVRVSPDALAHVLYTSGSTGRPKGVAVPQRAVARLVMGTNFVHLGPEDRLSHASNISFDAATYEIWGALLNGAAAVVVPREVVLSPVDYAAWVRERGVTSMILTTAVFVKLAREAPGTFEGMSEVLVGGEAMDPDATRAVLADRPPRRLINGYGPTENATYSTWHWVREVAPDAVSVPIGRPLANTFVCFLDGSFLPVPPGATGELCVGGEGLARGYVNRPELTAERFIPHPWSSGERLYRTGDLAHQRPDGIVEYLGRLDDQVKIRGFRIEPGEVQAVLTGHPGVRECAVVARQDRPGEIRLVAYVVGTSDGADLRAYLKDRLPDYMIPSAFVVLEGLPLTSNGKLDRRALPAPDTIRAVAGEGYAAPSDPVEELLAGIFADVLGLERAAGIHDDFFALGGHSLLATQVVSRIRAALGVELPLRRLFESPTAAELARAVREIQESRTAPPIVPVRRDGPLPLSFAQQRLWFLDRLTPGSAVYNVPAAVRFSGRLSPALLEAALGELVARHEILRTTFHQDSATGEPFQRVTPPERRTLPIVDLGGLARPEPEALRLAAEEASRPFDLERGPLARWVLLRLGLEDHVALFTLHHIVSDGWSMGVLASEVGALYGAVSPLPPLPVQYADFAVWQRSWLSGKVLEDQLGYWREHLKRPLPTLQLPTDRPRPAQPSDRGGSRPVAIPTATAAGLATLARRSGSTLFMVLLAGWKTLLHRYSGGTDLIVGTPIANRNRREVEGLIGFFVNTLALRTDLSGYPGFSELVERVRQGALGAYAHQDLPFERLVEAVAPERDLASTPLFQVMLALQNAPFGGLELPGLSLAPFPLEATHAAFDLTLTLTDRGSAGLEGGVEFSRDLYDPTTVDRMMAHLKAMLAEVVADPDQPLSGIPFLSAPERHQVACEWGTSLGEPAAGGSLHQLFEDQASRHPEAVALVSGEEELTYAELDDRASRLASRLRELGVGPESVVAVLAGSSPELVVAMLATWKAGGAYLPLDPAYPADRLRYILEDSGARLLLARPGSVDPPAGVTQIDLAGAWEGYEPRPDLSPSLPESLAWIIYTSGSTGRPKGVGVEHRAAAAHLLAITEKWQLGPGDRVLQFSAPSFDAVMEDLLPALFSGAAVVLRGDEVWEPARFLHRAAGLGVTVLSLPTAYWQAWVLDTAPKAGGGSLSREAGEGRGGGQIRLACVGGEAMSPEAARLWHSSPLAHALLLNSYGPTEAVVSATTQPVTVAPEPGALSVLIGRPIAGHAAWVLDPGGDLLPAGVPGELHLGGILARGYLGRPDLTAERFIPDPFSGRPGARLYRTGDRIRLLPDGRLDFVGRADNQLKLRGFRIEPGEIEAALVSHPQVRQAAVALRENLPGGRGLVAWLVLEGGGGDLPRAELRAWLESRLPAYMVPSVFATLPELPITPNGKVDRAALLRLDPAVAAEDGSRRFVPPRTPVEEVLAGIWTEVLGLDPARRPVGAFDNFFDLSGHSLLATQVVSRIREAFGVEVPLRRLFERATLADLAIEIEAAAGRPTGAAPELHPVPRDRPLPASFYQEWGYQIQKASPVSISIPLAVRVRGAFSPEVLRRSVSEVARRHEVLRTAFASADGRVFQVATPATETPLPVVDLQGLPVHRREATARRLASEDAARHFDLDRGPLFRLHVLVLGPEEHIVLLNVHHLVIDGWSTQILLNELALLYASFARGLPSPLPELPLQFADFAWWQREVFAREELPAQLAWWSRHLAGRPPLFELPGDRPRPAELGPGAVPSDLLLGPELTAALRALARSTGCSVSMTLIAGLTVLLHRYSGRDDVLLDSIFAARNRPELAGLIGFFMNTVNLRMDLSGSPSFRELLRRVRESVLASYAHQDTPFPKILEELFPKQKLHRTLLSRVMFNMVNFSEGRGGEGAAMPGPMPGIPLTFEVLILTEEPAKQDLLFTCEEGTDRIACRVLGATDIFEPESVNAIATDFEAVLTEAAANPELAVGQLLAEPRLLARVATVAELPAG